MILELFISGTITFLSSGLMVYWCLRTLLVLRETQEKVDLVLQADLSWGRQVWLMLRILLFPSSQMFAGW